MSLENRNDSIVTSIRAALDDANLKYEYNEIVNAFHFGFSLETKISPLRVFIFPRQSDFLIKTLANVKGDPANPEMMDKLTELIVKINYRLILGNFDLDLSDGEISFRFGVECAALDDLPITFVNTTIALATQAWIDYANCFLGIVDDGLAADAAIKLRK